MTTTTSKKRGTLYTKLVIPALLVAILGCFITSVVIEKSISSIMTKQVQEELNESVRVLLYEIESEKGKVSDALAFIRATAPSIDSVSSSYLNRCCASFGLKRAMTVSPEGKF